MLLVVLANVAFAADVDGFDPSSSVALGLGTPLTESPTLGREGPSADLICSNQEDLVVFRYDDGDVDPILSQLVGASLHGGWTFGDTARIDAFVPFYLYALAPEDGYAGPAFGDIRLQATFPLVGEPDDAFQFALVPKISLPTGTNKAYVGKGFDIGAVAALGGQTDRWGWTGNAGFNLTPANEVGPVSLGSSLDAGAGAWLNLDDHVRVGGDLGVAFGLPKGAGRNNVLGTWDIFAQANTEEGLGLLLGVGGGLINGLGAPEHRVFAGVTWGNAIRDQDKDGLWDNVDGCPTDPEDFDEFEDADGCPDVDNDGDKIVDLVDGCRNEAEDFDEFADNDGCPEDDNDHDYVKDVDDLCPLVAGEEKFQGCPDTDADGVQDSEDECPTVPGKVEFKGCPDRDNDRVPDARDACPDDPAPPEEDPALSDGCPKKAFLSGATIRITEKVNFAFNKSTIDPTSFGILDAVADVLAKYPWILKVEVAGHTDDVGRDTTNLRLSQSRVDSVMAYLVKKGIAKSRLSAKGYGEAKPVDTNRTDAGRANNRRVEFLVVSQSPPEAAVMPGAKPIPPVIDNTPPAAPIEVVPAAKPPAEKPPAEKAPAEKPTLNLLTPALPTGPAAPGAMVLPDLRTPSAPPPTATGTRTAPKPGEAAPTEAKPATAPAAAKPTVAAPAPEATPVPPAVTQPAAPSPEPGSAWGSTDTLAPPVVTPAEPEGSPWGVGAPPAKTVVTGPDGLLTVKLTGAPWADVYIDDQRISRAAPFTDFPIKPGTHQVSVVNPRTGFKFSATVEVEPGKPVLVDAKPETGPWGQ